MNNVSWFLYLSDLVQSLSIFFGITAFAGLVVFAGLLAYGGSKKDFERHGNDRWEYGDKVQKKAFKFLPLVILVLFMAFILPSKETMYMIAASQVGEQIIQLEQVQDIGGEAGGLAKDAIDLLRQQIQEQLTEKPIEGS